MGNKLREIRQERNLSINDLARMSGVAKSTISKIENLEVMPTQVIMCKICKTLRLRLDDVFLCD